MRERPLQRAETRATLQVRAMKIDGRIVVSGRVPRPAFQHKSRLMRRNVGIDHVISQMLASDTCDKHIADYERRSRALETRKLIYANEQTASRVPQDRHE
jgi:hypothetical protein